MNKGLAHIIRDKLTDIPFIDLFAGLVYVQTKADTIYRKDNDGNEDETDQFGTRIEYRFPVSCDVTGNTQCDPQGLQDLIPNDKRQGILYFEDNGTTPLESPGSVQKYQSQLRLVAWLNSKNVDIASCFALTPRVMGGIIERLRGNPFNAGDFQLIDIRVSGIPRANADIFSAYTYRETDTQYLMPPYEYFAIDLAITFRLNPYCLNYIETKTPTPCSN